MAFGRVRTEHRKPRSQHRYCARTGGAWFDGDSEVHTINFCPRDEEHANTAFRSIVHHEYGHHIIDSAGSGQAEYGEGMADTIVKGRNGLINAGEAAIKGDWKGVGKGLYDTANLALMFVPGAGQANAARNVGQQFAKELVKSGVKDSVKDEGLNQYDMAKGKEGNETSTKEERA